MDHFGLPNVDTENKEEVKRNYKGLKIFAGRSTAVATTGLTPVRLNAVSPDELLQDVGSSGKTLDSSS